MATVFGPAGNLVFGAQFAHPVPGAGGQLRMILVFPRRIFALEKLEQAMTAHLVARRFHQKGAAPARTDEGVNLPKQVFGQENVGASRHSVCIKCAIAVGF